MSDVTNNPSSQQAQASMSAVIVQHLSAIVDILSQPGGYPVPDRFAVAQRDDAGNWVRDWVFSFRIYEGTGHAEGSATTAAAVEPTTPAEPEAPAPQTPVEPEQLELPLGDVPVSHPEAGLEFAQEPNAA